MLSPNLSTQLLAKSNFGRKIQGFTESNTEIHTILGSGLKFYRIHLSWNTLEKLRNLHRRLSTIT